MGIVVPWLFLMAWEAYQGGYKGGSNPCPSSDPTKPCGQLPEPYRFFYGTVAMGFAGVVAQFNDRAGTLFAWALVLGAFGMHYAAQAQNQTQGA